MNPNQHKKINRIYHAMVIEMYGNACVDCGHSAETDSGELCADHIEQKRTHPESRYDLAAGICRCFDCHTKRHAGAVSRFPSPSKMPKETQEKQKKAKKPTICKTQGCPIFASTDPKDKGFCFKCAQAKK